MRVVITGIGVLTPIGVGKDEYWDSLIKGVSGIKEITGFETDCFDSHLAGEINGFKADHYVKNKNIRRMPRLSQMTVAIANLAIKDAGLETASFDKTTTGLILGTAWGEMSHYTKFFEKIVDKNPQYLSPALVPNMVINAPAGYVAIELGIKGYNSTICTRDTSASNAICYAYEVLKNKRANIMLAGGMEEFGYYNFRIYNEKKYLSSEDKEEVSRPFDKKRNGIILSEGVGLLVMETLEHALKRRATIYGEIIGYGIASSNKETDTKDIIAESMSKFMTTEGLKPNDIDYISLTANSSSLDVCEIQAIKKVFGKYAYSVSISAIKSMLGECLGSFGGIQLASSVLTILNNKIPPTINYEYKDPICDLNYVKNQTREQVVNIVLNNSVAEGNSVTIGLKRFEE